MDLNQATVQSLNISESIHFYTTLGLTLIDHSIFMLGHFGLRSSCDKANINVEIEGY